MSGLSGAARQALLADAVAHGLLTGVAACLPADDPGLRRRFESLAVAARLQDARNRDVLEEVLGLLRADGILPIALKGPILADRLYPEPALRVATDLDLLVREDDLPRATAALLAAGFHRPPPLVDAYQRRRHHHVHLSRARGPDVELHFRAHSDFGRFPEGEPWARAVSHRTARGSEVRILAPEDELVYLAAHAAGHMLARAGWLLDLWLFVERTPALDWSRVAERAAAYRCRRASAYALLHLQTLGAPVPQGPHLSWLGGTRQWVADHLAAATLARQKSLGFLDLRGKLQWTAFHLVLRDRAWSAAGWVAGEAAWVLRRRAHLVSRILTRLGLRRVGLGLSRISRNRPTAR